MDQDVGTIYDSGTNSVYVQTAATTPTVRNQVVLTHGSLNVADGNAYVIDADSGNFSNKGTAAGSGWKYRDGMSVPNSKTPSENVLIDVYIAVSWKMTFTYDFGGESAPVAVFLDLKKSTFASENPEEGYDFRKPATITGLETAKGFRVGFYGAVYNGTTTAAANAHNVVWGNHVPLTSDVTKFVDKQGYEANDKVAKDGIVYSAKAAIASGHDWNEAEWNMTGDITLGMGLSSDAKYVSGTSSGSTTPHTANDYVYYKDPYTPVESGAQDADDTDSPEKICVLTSTNNSVTVTCAAWFEGTDPNVVTGSALNCLKANMSFYSRSLKTA